MIAAALPRPALPAAPADRLIVGGTVLVIALTGVALLRVLLLTGHLAGLAGASPWLFLHLATVVPALPLGTWILVRPKGDRAHRRAGRIWAGVMATTALASFGVRHAGHLGPIHLLSLLVLASLPRAIVAAARGDLRTHMRGMRGVYIGSVVAGLFAFLPGRLLAAWLFG